MYNKKELLSLPTKEKLALAEDLWDSIDDDMLPVTDDEITFAKERLKLHTQNPNEGLTWEEFRKKIRDNQGF